MLAAEPHQKCATSDMLNSGIASAWRGIRALFAHNRRVPMIVNEEVIR
jgi:hypothetical protein